MAIKEQKPITMAEVVASVGDSEKAMDIKKFVKNFDIMDIEKAKKMQEELRALDLIKLKEEHIVKIVDFVPTSASELNKVIIEVSLDQDEINKILDVTGKY
ncbi:MAG: hypothetical protein OEL87_01955 [Nanoarchaeota archaeon]|nr:hypothetical protein [Nanoarchaeota archaeon]